MLLLTEFKMSAGAVRLCGTLLRTSSFVEGEVTVRGEFFGLSGGEV
jgi:hypothetical protein